jgi:hypothetical protein
VGVSVKGAAVAGAGVGVGVVIDAVFGGIGWRL